jgi:hypothetical protein
LSLSKADLLAVISSLSAKISLSLVATTSDSLAPFEDFTDANVATVLPKYKARPTATEYIIDSIKKQAGFEDGKIVFKNQDGTTMRVNGNDASVDDIVKGMQSKEVAAKQGMFFDRCCSCHA